MSPTDPRHGRPGRAGYDQHRLDHEQPCQPCRDAAARYERGRQLDLLNGHTRMTDATGTRRRMQALVALGHTFGRLGPALGMTQAGASHIANSTRNTVRTATADRVTTLYEQWSMTLPPQTTSTDRKNAAYARTVARRNHWAVPLAWEGLDMNDPNTEPYATTNTRPDPNDVDTVLVERVLGGDLSVAPDATTAERRLIVAAWTNHTGRPLRALEREAGWKPERYKTPAHPSTALTSKEHTAA